MTSDSTIRLYLREIAAYPLLNADDEIGLAERIALGCEEARALLINSNLRMVVKLAKGYHVPTMDLMDLISEGNIGLMKAVERFDPTRGVYFYTVAALWIHEAIRKAITKKGWFIRLPQHAVVEMRKRNAANEEQPSGAFLPVQSIDSALRDFLPADEEEDIKPEMFEAARKTMKNLDPRERKILSMRFGFGGKQPKTLRQAGKAIGLSHEMVRKIEIGAMRKMREATQNVSFRSLVWDGP